MSFEINGDDVEDYDEEVGTEWQDENVNGNDIHFDQDSQSLGYTMDKGNVVSLRNPENYCNWSMFTLAGTGDLLTTMQIAMGAHEWDDEQVQMVTDWTDGYKAIFKQVVGFESVSGKTHGLCFGVEPTVNGGWCHIYKNDAIGDIQMGGHQLRFVPADEWSNSSYVENSGR
jgi:hypothetical protein